MRILLLASKRQRIGIENKDIAKMRLTCNLHLDNTLKVPKAQEMQNLTNRPCETRQPLIKNSLSEKKRYLNRCIILKVL
jgi:hypothetical protein